jgi:hypothetical protein
MSIVFLAFDGVATTPPILLAGGRDVIAARADSWGDPGSSGGSRSTRGQPAINPPINPRGDAPPAAPP